MICDEDDCDHDHDESLLKEEDIAYSIYEKIER